MNPDKFIKTKDFIHTCPFCGKELAVSQNPRYKANARVGYECRNCFVPNVKTKSGLPFSRYIRATMENVRLSEEKVLEQIIVLENFYLPTKEPNRWYNVMNDLIKSQTIVALMRPAEQEDYPYKDDVPLGMVPVRYSHSAYVFLPFVDSWDLTDQEATISKLQTYLLFR